MLAFLTDPCLSMEPSFMTEPFVAGTVSLSGLNTMLKSTDVWLKVPENMHSEADVSDQQQSGSTECTHLQDGKPGTLKMS